MKINCFSVTFWFNIYLDHDEILKDFNSELKEEYPNFTISNTDNNNLLTPLIMASNSEKKSNLTISRINLQYTLEDTNFTSFKHFKDITLKLLEILETNNITVLHSSLFISGEKEIDKALEVITKSTLQIKFPKKIDELGRVVPIPLIPWQEALEEQDILEVIYEINDKCSFDYEKNYHTTEFYLNKMLYILENDYESDIDSLIEKGEF